MFGSIFITIGAACSDLKDAQGMMTPAMLLMMLPWMTWFSILNAPDSTSRWRCRSFPRDAVPDAAAHHAAARSADVADRLCSVLTAVTSMAAVYAAGKIFRTGLLMQGKAATFGEMWKWVRAD
jgi:ABC-type Na+ efflux pump permease subunit